MPKARHATTGRIETSSVAALLIMAIGLCGFLAMAAAALDLIPHGFDPAILLALRESGNIGHPVGPKWLHGAMRDVTALGSTVTLVSVTAVGVLYLLLIRRFGIALHLLCAMAGGQVLGALLKEVVRRPRPDIVPHLVSETSFSFPSGHAMMSAIAYITLALLVAHVLPGRRARVFVFALAVLATLAIGVSRLYLGVHWPSDVVAGWCVGSAWAMLCWLAARGLRRRRTAKDAGNG